MTIEKLIQLIAYIIVFAISAFGLHWVLEKYKMPAPVYWAVGGFLLVIILLFLAKELGVR